MLHTCSSVFLTLWLTGLLAGCAALPQSSTESIPASMPLPPVQATSTDEIAELREATAQFQTTPAARAAGYDLIVGFDDCIQDYRAGGIGYHFINVNLLDTTLDWSQPEAMVYAPDANGSLQFGAVEYIVPAAEWDAEHTQPPQFIDQGFDLNEKLGMYVLYVWIWKNNPSGMFEDWNPDVSCPKPHDWQGSMRWREQLDVKNR